MLDLSDFHEACLLACLSCLSKDLSDLCATITFELTVQFQRKSPRYLIPTDFMKNRGLVKQCPSKDLVCPHRALSTASVSYPPPPGLCGGGFVRGTLFAAAVGPECCSLPSPSSQPAPPCCARGRSPEHWGTAGGDMAEGLLRCLLKATGCGSLTTQPTAYFQHKQF